MNPLQLATGWMYIGQPLGAWHPKGWEKETTRIKKKERTPFVFRTCNCSSPGSFWFKEISKEKHMNPIPIGFCTVSVFDSKESVHQIPLVYCSILVESYSCVPVFFLLLRFYNPANPLEAEILPPSCKDRSVSCGTLIRFMCPKQG